MKFSLFQRVESCTSLFGVAACPRGQLIAGTDTSDVPWTAWGSRSRRFGDSGDKGNQGGSPNWPDWPNCRNWRKRACLASVHEAGPEAAVPKGHGSGRPAGQGICLQSEAGEEADSGNLPEVWPESWQRAQKQGLADRSCFLMKKRPAIRRNGRRRRRTAPICWKT